MRKILVCLVIQCKTHIAPNKIGSVELDAPAGSSHREDVSPSKHVDTGEEEEDVLVARF